MKSVLQIARTVVWSYLKDKEQTYSRIVQFARITMCINAAIGVGKIIVGYYSHSFFFVMSGIYNLCLGVAKFVALKGYKNNSIEKSKIKEYHCYGKVGAIVLIASTAYIIGSLRVIFGEHSTAHFSMIMVVEISAITVIEIIVALNGIFARRREMQPILEALKLTSLISALIGLVLVQTAILGHRGGEVPVYFDYVGVVLGGVSVCIGAYMIVSARLKITATSQSPAR
jgi:hypothetical protein